MPASGEFGRVRSASARVSSRRSSAPAQRENSSSTSLHVVPMATLLVWDFDWSLINENTDTFVVQQLDPSGDVWRRGKQKMQQGVGWTELMDWALGELRYDRAALDAALSAIPITDGARRAVQLARDMLAEQRILSGANSHYIATVLAAHGHADAFSQIETNPAAFEGERLRVRPHQEGEEYGGPLEQEVGE